MSRPLRIQFPGAWYHVTSRGNERNAIFKSKKDREKFLSYLESANERYRAIIHAFCLMSNHYHLLIETPASNISQILHHINGAYTTYFNVKRRRSGHLFQGRYKAIVVEKDSYCQELSRYIHLNAVRVGIVEMPGDYLWSSYPYYVGLKECPDWLTTDAVLVYFHEDRSVARKEYRKFVEKTFYKEIENPFKEVFASTFLGREDFIKRAKDKWIGFKNADVRNMPALRQLVDRPSLEKIQRSVEAVIGEGDSHCKKICLYLSQEIGGYTLKQIGSYYNMRGSAVSQSNKRFKQCIGEEKKMEGITKEIKIAIRNVEC